jgi:hypothetical protein
MNLGCEVCDKGVYRYAGCDAEEHWWECDECGDTINGETVTKIVNKHNQKLTEKQGDDNERKG